MSIESRRADEHVSTKVVWIGTGSPGHGLWPVVAALWFSAGWLTIVRWGRHSLCELGFGRAAILDGIGSGSDGLAQR